MNNNLTILGGGSFGTAIANIAAENGNTAYLWMRNADKADEIRRTRENKQYLPGCQLDEKVIPTADFKEALSQSSIVVVSVPSKSFRDVLVQAAPYIQPDACIVSTTKGIEAGSFSLMSEIVREILPNNPSGVLSGPNLAKEIGKRYLTATVIASSDPALRAKIQTMLSGTYFRIYANVDTYGVELGGALKNIYAIISGLIDAQGYGQNTKAMIITRSLAEMSRFAVCMGANPLTFLGLAGVGDLIVTCESPLSRNYRVGYEVGKGRSLQEAIDSLGEVAEGINTLKLVKDKSEELDIYMPLVKGLHAILYEQQSIEDVIQHLMGAQQSTDVEFILPREQISQDLLEGNSNGE